MKESYNTRFFQFFLVLALTIIVSETVLTHVSYQAYAREAESDALVINEDSAETTATIESALGKPRTLSVTLALKAESQGISKLASPARPVQPLSHTEVQAAAKQAQEALEETKTEQLKKRVSQKYPGEGISKEEEASEVPAVTEPVAPAEPEAVPDAVPEEEPVVVPYEEEPEAEPEPEPAPEPEYTEPEPEAVEPEEPEPEYTEPEEPEDEEPSSTENYTCLGEFKLTAYCPCAKCCGHETGITATGTVATAGRTIAVDPNVIPYGSTVYIEGYGTYIAEDTGGFAPTTIDIFFNSHDEALQFGVQYATVYIVE